MLWRFCSSELQPTVSSPVEEKVTVHKRHSSPSLLEEEAKFPKKMHSIAGPSNAKGETDSSSALSVGNKQSNFVVETGVSFLASSEKLGFVWPSFID